MLDFVSLTIRGIPRRNQSLTKGARSYVKEAKKYSTAIDSTDDDDWSLYAFFIVKEILCFVEAHSKLAFSFIVTLPLQGKHSNFVINTNK